MFKSKKLLALVILSSIAQGLPLLGPNAFATNILGQPDFMNPIPPPAQPTFETSWGNNPSGIAQQPSANSGSSHTGHDSNGVGQPYQAPLMSQPTFGGQSNSNNAALPNNVPTPYEAPKFLTLPAAPNLFAPQNPVPQAVDMQGMAFELLWAAQTFDNFYGITQVNKINSLASCQNSLLDQNQLNARYDQLRNSSDVDNLINDLEALATELNSRSRQLDSINHETLKTFNDNQKSPHQQIRGLNQAGFDKYYKSFSEVSKYFVETWGWTKTSINQLKDRKKHIGLSEREQRIQDAVDRATADARNRLEQARQATSNRRAEIRELQRIRANVNSSQIQQVHVERIASEVNEALPRMTAHMEQSAGDY
ncbi:MAG: hypothetical protein ABIQ95_08175, partial [Bdellovibrionia bacterium]